MAKVSLNQAAKDTGVSLSTLSRWRKKGKITADKKDGGGYLIDTSEYDRIKDMIGTSSIVQPLARVAATDLATPPAIPLQEEKIAMLESRLKEKDEIISDIRQERDDWKKQAQALLLKSPEKTVERPKGFWATILGK